nr:hypothetical protein [Streptomyces lasiicapitis]
MVVDASGHVGRVMGHEGPNYQLRHPEGGREWKAASGTLRPATQAEVLSAAVSAANQRSRGEIP